MDKPQNKEQPEHTGLARIKTKHFHKLQGRLLEYSKGYGDATDFVLAKGKGKDIKYYPFITLDKDVIALIESVEPDTTLIVLFSIKSRSFNLKWYTTIWALKADVYNKKERYVKETQAESTLFRTKGTAIKNAMSENEFLESAETPINNTK
jgi:hypothetical protein